MLGFGISYEQGVPLLTSRLPMGMGLTFPRGKGGFNIYITRSVIEVSMLL